MTESYAVTLLPQTYERVRQWAQIRRQSAAEFIEAITVQPTHYIECRPNIQGGDACIARTRIPVWVLAAMHKQGDIVDDLLEAYPNLTAAQVHAALSYYYEHRAEIDSVITVQNAKHRQIRGE